MQTREHGDQSDTKQNNRTDYLMNAFIHIFKVSLQSGG